MQSILLVGAGGFLGSVSRFLISYYTLRINSTHFPFETFVVNLLGSFLLGVLMAAALTENISSPIRLLLATGFCGGFTTFSTFSFEFFSLLQNGHAGHAFLYAAGSLLLGLLFVWLGFSLGKVV